MYPELISENGKIVGRIVGLDGVPRRACVEFHGGRIEQIVEADGSASAAHDFGDALLLPGAVDVHVHTRSYAEEGIERCTRAAAAGGVTTIVDMPYDASGPVDSLDAFERKVADVQREAVIDVALWATVPPRGPVDQVADLVAAGAAAFKLSTFET
ncbi:MAG: amidohydrolase family protein, partial [Solirubrobacteraceae bacterium]